MCQKLEYKSHQKDLEFYISASYNNESMVCIFTRAQRRDIPKRDLVNVQLLLRCDVLECFNHMNIGLSSYLA